MHPLFVKWIQLLNTIKIQSVPYALFVLMLPFRVHREPAFQDTLALVEYFLDRPEGGEGENAEQG